MKNSRYCGLRGPRDRLTVGFTYVSAARFPVRRNLIEFFNGLTRGVKAVEAVEGLDVRNLYGLYAIYAMRPSVR